MLGCWRQSDFCMRLSPIGWIQDQCPDSKPLAWVDMFISSLIDAPGAVRYLIRRRESFCQIGRGCDTRRSHGTVRSGGAAHEYCSHESERDMTPWCFFKFDSQVVRRWLEKSCDREVDASSELELGFLILTYPCPISTPRCIYPQKRSVSCLMMRMTPV